MLTMQELETLAASPLFGDWQPEELAALLETVEWKTQDFARGETIYTPGSFRRELAAILSGQVLVTRAEGELVVSLLTPGSLFGAAALFNDEEAYVSTLTARSACRILFLPQASVQVLIDSQMSFRRRYIRYLSGRIRFLSDEVDALSRGTGEKKLSAYLLQHMDEKGLVQPGCSMTELAARLNISRASLYREMQKLEERGALIRHGKTLMIQKPEELSIER
ncbi:MAG: Crp/Fnr family transcriptional regulator [Lachnospiraceae bacterium]|nr:Crp/Fnr family transcriptional regulator [Lachnospiraceae bacterium]